MRREEYLSRLLKEIKDFPQEDQEQIREYFEEMICDRMEDGESEEEILRAIGSPEQAARKLRSEYEARPTAGRNLPEKIKNTARNRGDGFASHTEAQSGGDLAFIRVQAENAKIHVRRVKKGPVEVLFDPREGIDEVWTSEEGGGFSFVHRMKKFWFFDIWEFGRSKWITVQIPESFHGRLELLTKNAAVQAENMGELEDLQVETSNSKICVARVKADRIELQTSNAPVSAAGVSGRVLWVKTTNGHISLEDAEFSGAVEARTSNSAVEVSGISGQSITLQTSNAAIRGWLEGSIADYDIESRTSNASSTLPTAMRSGKGKRLKVRTSNAKIDLSFSKDS